MKTSGPARGQLTFAALAEIEKNMEVVKIGRWGLRCDPKATRSVFLNICLGSPESCGCSACLNFAALRDRAYPPEALAIFEQLGIDLHKESEIWHTHCDETGSHHYGGFFHFVGSIEYGEDAKSIVNSAGSFALESINENFQFGITSNTALIPESFAGNTVTQLEFQTRVPWTLDKKTPD